ncbi:MAG: sulfite exporter TauE/SafE family protein [Sneathiella sp.]|nr:sulfite exporter TauE/SafE family protein [Sneathiella sp.]
MIADPLFYLIAVPAILLIGISKGGMAGSLGMLGVPLMSILIPPVQAAAIILPILCLMDIFGLIAYRRNADWKNLSYLLPGALVGIGVGTLLFQYLNEDMVRLFLGAIAVIFTLNYWLVPTPETNKSGPSLLKGSFWGTISGFTSFVAHAGGPPIQFYMLPQKIDKKLFVGTSVWFFLVVNYVKLIPYAYLGQFSTENLATSVVLFPLAPIGIWLGVKALKYLPEKLFYKIAYLLLFVTGSKLVLDGLNGLFNFF